MTSVIRLRERQPGETQAAFTLRQQAAGLTWSPYSILTDPDLVGVVRPADQFMHDWCHCLLCSGVWNQTTHQLLEQFHASGFTNVYQQLHDYISNWRAPSRAEKAGQAHSIFDPTRRSGNVKAESFRCQASEALGVYMIVACFLRRVCLPAGRCVDACAAYLSLANLVHCITAIPRGQVTPGTLRFYVHQFLALYVVAFDVYIPPKFHWLLHLAREYQRFGTLQSCLCHERKHKIMRRYGNNIMNTSTFEFSMISEVLRC